MGPSPFSSKVGILASVLGLVLLAAGLCNAGISSSFVRKAEKSVDMPLDSDVFAEPPGYNSPQQVTFYPFSFLFLVYDLIVYRSVCGVCVLLMPVVYFRLNLCSRFI